MNDWYNQSVDSIINEDEMKANSRFAYIEEDLLDNETDDKPLEENNQPQLKEEPFDHKNSNVINNNDDEDLNNIYEDRKMRDELPFEVVKDKHRKREPIDEDMLVKDYEANGEFDKYPDLTKETRELLRRNGITKLFPIQQQCFKLIYDGNDIIARDVTGSGKTLAFCLPLIEYFRKVKMLGHKKTQIIALAPTRELAIQITNEFEKLKHYDDEYSTITIYGGTSVQDQRWQLNKGVDIIVGTTGRVLDHIGRNNIDFSQLKCVILDEADLMIKQGFKEDVEKILQAVKSQCRNDVQKCLFSATIPQWVIDVAKQFFGKDYKMIDLAKNLNNKTPINVQHQSISCPFHERQKILYSLLESYGPKTRTLIFTQTKREANDIIHENRRARSKIYMEVMHGDIEQEARETALTRFKDGRSSVLVATDVASRGLDIPNVDVVIQLDPHNEVETYIHRAGRTARAGKIGTCITFYTKKNEYLINNIEREAGIKFENMNRFNIPVNNDNVDGYNNNNNNRERFNDEERVDIQKYAPPPRQEHFREEKRDNNYGRQDDQVASRPRQTYTHLWDNPESEPVQEQIQPREPIRQAANNQIQNQNQAYQQREPQQPPQVQVNTYQNIQPSNIQNNNNYQSNANFNNGRFNEQLNQKQSNAYKDQIIDDQRQSASTKGSLASLGYQPFASALFNQDSYPISSQLSAQSTSNPYYYQDCQTNFNQVNLSNLNMTLKGETLQRFFQSHHLSFINLQIASDFQGSQSGTIEFKDFRDAEFAVKKLNGCEIEGKPVCIEWMNKRNEWYHLRSY